MRSVPYVSIVVPCFNTERYIKKSLFSLTHQTLENIEIVCVNDGSTDETASLIMAAAKDDPRIKLISQENGGYGKAVNLGISNSIGEYIGILEPDDQMDLFAYQSLYETAIAYELDICKADFYKFWENERGDIQARYSKICSYNDPYSFPVNVENCADQLLLNSPRGICTGIYRKEFLDRNEVRLHESPGASYQDNGFYFKTMLSAKRIMYIKAAYYWYRQDNPNSSFKCATNYSAMLEEHSFIEKWLRADESRWSKFKEYYAAIALGNNLFTLSRLRNDLKMSYAKEISRILLQQKTVDSITFEKCSVEQRRLVEDIINNPAGFCRTIPSSEGQKGKTDDQTEVLKAKNREYQLALEKIKKSNSWKIGRALTSLPRAIKKHVKR